MAYLLIGTALATAMAPAALPSDDNAMEGGYAPQNEYIGAPPPPKTYNMSDQDALFNYNGYGQQETLDKENQRTLQIVQRDKELAEVKRIHDEFLAQYPGHY